MAYSCAEVRWEEEGGQPERSQLVHLAGWKPARRAKPETSELHNPFAQIRVLSRHQFLRQIIAGAIRVARCAGEMVVDPHRRRATEVASDRQYLGGWFALIDLVLREGARRANREEFCRDTDETRQQQLFAIELGTESCHRVE